MKPLVSLDIETTGLDKNTDRIIQFAAVKFDRENKKNLGELNLLIRPDDPQCIMSIGAFIKHGIHPDKLKDKPTFKEVAQQIYSFINGCDILTYNGVYFDLPFLMNEFKRAGIDFLPSEYKCYDAYKEECRRNGTHLVDSFKRYTGKTMEEAGLAAHDAMSDSKACLAVFYNQCKAAEVQPEQMLTDDDMLVMADFNGSSEVTVNFGRYKGVPLKILKVADPSYITWMLSTNISKKTRDLLKQP